MYLRIYRSFHLSQFRKYLFNMVDPINKQKHYDIPLDERYETIDFTPNKNLLDIQELYRLLDISPHTLDNITYYKVNKSIPFNERYETIDFIPKI